GARVAHFHAAARRGDGTGIADVLEQGGLAGPESDGIAQRNAQVQAGHGVPGSRHGRALGCGNLTAAMERREFLKACAATCALAAPDVLSAQDLKPRFYSRTQLLNEVGRPLRAADLVVDRNYIFHYPFEATPCFLLNLGKPTVRDVELKTEDSSAYKWSGGVGPKRAIVGFSAICAHRLNYPTPQVSFISYRDKSTASPTARANVIHCC